MKIVQRKIKDLIEAEYNPRKLSPAQFEQIKSSIQRFGFVDPVIVNTHKDRKNIIVGGHQRVKVARELGIDDVPTVEVCLDAAQEKELNIRLNKNTGEFDFDLLADFFDVADLCEWGFDEGDFDIEEELIDGLTDEDAVPEVPEEPTVKLGQIWKLGDHRLMCGDSTEKAQVETLMDGEKADMVFTDPPYNVNYGNIKHQKFKLREIKNDNMSVEDFAMFCSEFIDRLVENCDGCFYVWAGVGADSRIMFTVLDNKLHCSTTVVWNKDQFTLGRGKYQNKWESCWFGWNKDGSNFTDDRKLTNVWDFDRNKASDLHPTMKPVAICEYAISHASDKSHSVLDLFLGSGSTLIACEKTGRKCYGMELDQHYCDVIIKRWEDFTGKKAELVE